MFQIIGFLLLALITGALLGAAVAQSLTSLAIFGVAAGAWLAYSVRGTGLLTKVGGAACFVLGLFTWLGRG
jgi:hypothetical protein